MYPENIWQYISEFFKIIRLLPKWLLETFPTSALTRYIQYIPLISAMTVHSQNKKAIMLPDNLWGHISKFLQPAEMLQLLHVSKHIRLDSYINERFLNIISENSNIPDAIKTKYSRITQLFPKWLLEIFPASLLVHCHEHAALRLGPTGHPSPNNNKIESVLQFGEYNNQGCIIMNVHYPDKGKSNTLILYKRRVDTWYLDEKNYNSGIVGKLETYILKNLVQNLITDMKRLHLFLPTEALKQCERTPFITSQAQQNRDFNAGWINDSDDKIISYLK